EPPIDDKFAVTEQVEQAPSVIRVEDPNLDSAMRRDRNDLLVAYEIIGVVDQQPHAYAAIGGTQHGVDHELAGDIVLDDEILQIEGTLSGGGKVEPCAKTLCAIGEETEPRESRVRPSRRRDG